MEPQKVSLTEQQVKDLLNAIKQVTVCVIGDVCLDLYWYADMKRSRLSRETPHYPLPVVRESYTPGGCGNVMNNVHALGVKQLLPISVVGCDWRGFLLTGWLRQHGIDTTNMVQSERGLTPCYCKPMRMGISDVIYEDPRLDFENFEPITKADEEAVLAALDAAAKTADVIAVSDQYHYGVITPRVRDALSALAKRMPVIVDSRERAGEYTGVIVKPNEVEAAQAIGRDITGKTLTDEEYADIACALQRKNGRPVVVTLGERGALWCDENTLQFAPTIKAGPPVDIVGAGDTFLSAFSAALAAGAPGGQALSFANLASGVTVKKIGTTGTANGEEILQKYRENYA
ncbi:MAG: PfkB family carbohydrate kinase [Pygmaiobacter sp.]|nr:PfkB family carbohydrate kinase [Pygmaiobacter sp.]